MRIRIPAFDLYIWGSTRTGVYGRLYAPNRPEPPKLLALLGNFCRTRKRPLILANALMFSLIWVVCRGTHLRHSSRNICRWNRMHS